MFNLNFYLMEWRVEKTTSLIEWQCIEAVSIEDRLKVDTYHKILLE